MENKEIVLITGATGGLGKAFVNEYAKKDCTLFLTATKKERLEALKQEILAIYPSKEIIVFPCDLSSNESRQQLFEYISSNNISITTLINNAGYITEGSIKNSDNSTLLKCIQVNCEGVIDLTKYLLDNKKEKLDIITISSMAGDYPMPYMAIYSATKSMLTNFMLSIRFEYKKDNVKVLVVKPGAIATNSDMIEAIKAQGLKGKLSAVEANKIAVKSIKKLQRNKATFTPGFFNKLTQFVCCLAPTKLKIKAIGKMWKKSQTKRDIK